MENGQTFTVKTSRMRAAVVTDTTQRSDKENQI